MNQPTNIAVMSKVSDRLAFLRGVLSPLWVRYVAPILAFFAFYDLTLSQFVPETWAAKLPKVWMVVNWITGLLPWWGWLSVLALALTVASFEYSYRRTTSLQEPMREAAAETSEEQSPYMEGYEVIAYMADESAWGQMIARARSPNDMQYNPRLQAFVEFRERAQRGLIRILGRLGGQGQHQEIPATYWLSAGLDLNSTLRKQASDTAPAIPYGDRIPIYRNVVISRADVYKTWPSREAASEFVSMNEAAALAYEEARKVKSWWALAAERLGGDLDKHAAATPEEILSYMSTLIERKIPIYGVRPPSSFVEKIEGRNKAGYAHLQVRRTDLEAVLEYIRNSVTTEDRI